MTLALHNFRNFCRCSVVNFIQKSQCHTLKTDVLPKSVYKQLGEQPAEIFSFIKNNHGYLSGQHYVQALKKLQRLSFKSNDIKNSNDFAELCNELKKQITTLDVSEAVLALNALTKFNVEKNTVIYESLLQIIRSNINSLVLEDVITLQLDLQNAPQTPLINAILTALPTIFEIQLPRIERDNIHLLASCLVFVTKQQSKNYKTLKFLLDTISDYRHEIPLVSAKFILKSIRFLPNSEITHQRLLKRIQNVIIDKINSVSFNDAMVVLKSIQYHKKNLKAFYNEQMVDTLVNDVIIKNDVGLEKGIEALEKLVIIGHEQFALLDYIAMKFLELSMSTNYQSLNMLDSFVSAMAMSDYKPVFWDKIQELILENAAIESYENLLQIVFNLAVLDCYSDKLLRKIFESNANIEIMTSDRKQQILRLYQFTKTLYKDYDGPRPLEDKFELLADWDQYSGRIPHIYKALEIAIGGSQFIETRMGTKLGHFIDYVILWDKENAKPIPINYKSSQKFEKPTTDNINLKPITYLEDISIPEDSQVLLFVDIPVDGYTINTMQLKGCWNSYMKTLEAMNYLVIPICSHSWLQLSDKEKIPYLLHAIRLKCAVNQHHL